MKDQRYLYTHIPAMLRMIEQDIIDANGEIAPPLEQALQDALNQGDEAIEHVATLIREAQLDENRVKEERQRLQALEGQHKRRKENLKEFLLRFMQATGIERHDGDFLKARTQRNSQPSITWLGSPEEIPEGFRRVTIELDARAAKDAYFSTSTPGDNLPEGINVEWGHHVRIW